MATVEVRPARPEDREAVLAFCRQTWEWGDYIEYVWDEWLHDARGVLFVVTVEGKPAGVANMRMLNETDAWLEGMRVDPAHRQQGLSGSARGNAGRGNKTGRDECALDYRVCQHESYLAGRTQFLSPYWRVRALSCCTRDNSS